MARLGGGTQSGLAAQCSSLHSLWLPGALEPALLCSCDPGLPGRSLRPWGTASPLLSCSEQLNAKTAEEDQASRRAPVAPAVRAGLALQIKVLTPQKLIAASTRAPSAVASLASQPSPGR